ncbi:Long-chain-fatty-acid-CoA ligase 3 [Sarcoptes scabiei]|nr:Long-chain-fatty-acid-CoA ligase 3 [Sarcoptes scabiei]
MSDNNNCVNHVNKNDQIVSKTMFTDEEAEVYDRQIRLWGLQTQQTIRVADILVIGLDGIATEVVKNLVLTGINSITMIDDKLVTKFDMLSNLFTRNQIGLKRAEACQKYVLELNPMVDVKIKDGSLKDLLIDADQSKEYIKQFHVVILVNYDLESSMKLNLICNESNVPFVFACAWGFLSMVFLDLGQDFNENKFITLKQAFAHKNLSLKQMRNNSKRDQIKLSKYRSIFASIMTMFNYHRKFDEFPTPCSESNRNEIHEKILSIERETLNELNSSSTVEKNGQISEPLWQSLSRQWHTKIFGHFTFISSIVGGFLAQETIRIVTKDKSIDYNLFLFYDNDCYNVKIGL